MVRTLYFHYCGPGFDSWSGNRILQAKWHGKKKIHISMNRILKNKLIILHVDKMVEHSERSCFLVELKWSSCSGKQFWQLLINLDIHLTCTAEFPLQAICPEERKTMFTPNMYTFVYGFIIIPLQTRNKCPPVGQLVHKVWYMYSLEY